MVSFYVFFDKIIIVVIYLFSIFVFRITGPDRFGALFGFYNKISCPVGGSRLLLVSLHRSSLCIVARRRPNGIRTELAVQRLKLVFEKSEIKTREIGARKFLAAELAGRSAEQSGQRQYVARPQCVQRRRLAVHLIHGEQTDWWYVSISSNLMQNVWTGTFELNRLTDAHL